MLKYEQEVITSLLSNLRNALQLLGELKEKDLDTLQKDPHLLSSAKYNLIVAIEAAIDICNHLISKNNYRIPDSYSDSFRVISEQGIISFDFAENQLTKMARFRNRLVHQYWAVDPDLLYEILQNNLADFERFIHEVKEKL